ncbi:hypothetical protein [Oceanobacillus rekensis]|uniref:hypothetical protein n=1 Tax=Oceanobacillus rekensis TaxID=937927 RepID=UPI00159499E8|nr:hypothetical protein [Oceanobacillus rekensis]
MIFFKIEAAGIDAINSSIPAASIYFALALSCSGGLLYWTSGYSWNKVKKEA